MPPSASRIYCTILLLAVVAFPSLLSAQITARDWITAGRSNLRLQSNANLEIARQSFARAVQLEPANAEALVLEVGATLAAEFLRPEFQQELAAHGVNVIDPNIYGAVFDYPQDENQQYVPPPGVGSGRILAYANTRRSEVDRLLGLLQRVTNPDFSITLSAQETGTTPLRIDFMDVRLLRMIGHLQKALLSIGNSHNSLLEYSALYQLVNGDLLTPERLLSDFPDLLKFTNASQRTEAREQLRLANEEFQKAVDFYLERRPSNPPIDYLFDFEHAQEAEQAAAVAQFLADALWSPQTVPLDNKGPLARLAGKTINLAPFFVAANSPRSLLPTRFDRGFFRRDSWPSATLGGLLGTPEPDLLNEFGAATRLLQATLYRPYDFSFYAGSNAPPPWSESPRPPYRPFSDLRGLSSDSRGNLYAADGGLNVIRRLSPDGRLTTIAGVEWTTLEQKEQLLAKERLGQSQNYRQASTAVLDSLTAIAVDPNDNVYFSSARRIYRLSANGMLSALAGSDAQWGSPGPFDGVGGSAKFNHISAMAADRQGNLYVADGGASLRKVTPQGVVTTLAGVSGWGWGGGGLPRWSWSPSSLWLHRWQHSRGFQRSHLRSGFRQLGHSQSRARRPNVHPRWQCHCFALF